MHCGRYVLLAVLLVGLHARLAHATPLLNGSFESGWLPWSTLGDVTQVGSVNGFPPTSGSSQALITTGDGAALVGSLETFLSLPFFALDQGGAAMEGSAIVQTITASAGQTFQFSWAFLTKEEDGVFPALGDFAFLLVNDQLTVLATALDNGLQTLSGTPYPFGTSRTVSTYTFQNAGTFRVGFGVVDIDDAAVDSALLLDSVGPLADTGQPVPEPGTLLLLGCGLLGIVRRLARR